MAPRLDQQPSGSNMSIPPPPLYSFTTHRGKEASQLAAVVKKQFYNE